MPVQVIPDTDFFGPNLWRKRHSTRDRHCFSIPFRPTAKNGAPPARSKQRVAVKPTTHIALHPYPHILSVCAYSSVTNAVGPLSLSSLVYYQSQGALRGLPATSQTADREAGPRAAVRLARLTPPRA